MWRVIVVLCVAAVAARADSLELKNGSLIRCKFMGGTQTSISFHVGLSAQSYDVADIRSLRFDSGAQGASPSVPSKQPTAPSAIGQDEVAKSVPSLTIPAGTRILVRTIDAIDYTKNRVGYRFQASLEEPLWVDGNTAVPKGTDVWTGVSKSRDSVQIVDFPARSCSRAYGSVNSSDYLGAQIAIRFANRIPSRWCAPWSFAPSRSTFHPECL